MKTIEISTSSSLAACVRRAGATPLIVVDAGKPVAAVVRLRGADAETAALVTNPEFIALIQRSRARLRTEGGLSSDEVRRQLGIAKSRRNRPARARRRA